MQKRPEDRLIEILKYAGAGIISSLPCDRARCLLDAADSCGIRHIKLTREEEGVGISAGAALCEIRPAMIVQSSGIGNMLNAILSLTQFYELPLAVFISWRGVYKEGIPAQIPMGRAVSGLLKAAGVGTTELHKPDDLDAVPGTLETIYGQNKVHAFLMSPALWESGGARAGALSKIPAACAIADIKRGHEIQPALTRFGVIKSIIPALKGNLVVCNLGVPCKELHAALPQESNFYMLGSMGMAAPIGLGVALNTNKRVFVIDGDGSILMNPGTLATVASNAPGNLTIIAIDNASYGSTGGQPTLTGGCVDLLALAQAMGIKNALRACDGKSILEAAMDMKDGPAFIHAPAIAGNSDSPNIPLDRLEIKDRFMMAVKA